MGEMVPGPDDPDDGSSPTRRRRWWIVAGVAVVAVVLASLPLLLSLNDLESVPVDPQAARERLVDRSSVPADSDPEVVIDPGASEPSVEPTDQPSTGADVADRGYQTFMVIGGDERAGLGGSRADVILFGLVPQDGSDPIMFSLPRDLWLDDPCRGGQQRINAAYNGCQGVANGFELTSIVVEDFTGIAVDHVAALDFEGFKDVINAVGGVRICVDNPVRDGELSLPAGCTRADGDQALGWVRSRKTQELVDGKWRTMPGVNDLTRNRRQQDVLLQLLGRVGSFGTLTNLYSFADGVSDSVSLGAGLSLLDGARLAWSMRGRVADIQRFSIPVKDMTTSGGAQVLVPTEPFATTFERELGIPLDARDG